MPSVTTQDYLLCLWEIFFTCFSPKGLSSGITYIKITKKNYWVMSGSHVNETSFFTINRFILKGNCGVY